MSTSSRDTSLQFGMASGAGNGVASFSLYTVGYQTFRIHGNGSDARSPAIPHLYMTSPLTGIPKDLPVPIDDGACRRLVGLGVPDVGLRSTSGAFVNVRERRGTTVVYIYPLTGRPNIPLPKGWNDIPGARGCTPEACGFRDHYSELRRFGAEVFGLSTQSTEYQREARKRLELPFELLSDEAFAFTDALRLPTFVVGSLRLLKRSTLICNDGVIRHVFYPIFPPDQHAASVVAYLRPDDQTKDSTKT